MFGPVGRRSLPGWDGDVRYNTEDRPLLVVHPIVDPPPRDEKEGYSKAWQKQFWEDYGRVAGDDVTQLLWLSVSVNKALYAVTLVRSQILTASVLILRFAGLPLGIGAILGAGGLSFLLSENRT